MLDFLYGEECKMETKFCEKCGEKIAIDAIICPKCGRQVGNLKTEEAKTNPQIIINNTNSNANTMNGGYGKKECNKWIALLLCLFLGYFGGHKFYEGKAGMGILYILTFGFFGIGVCIDFIVILCKPNPYYV